MYALEITFQDSLSPETLLVKRHKATIGSGESAHVVIDDFAASGAEIHLTRGLGRQFRCELRYPNKEPKIEVFDSSAKLEIDNLTLFILALDLDLFPKDGETPDKSGLRLIRLASGRLAPQFPALVVPSSSKDSSSSLVISFQEGQSIDIGRGRAAQLRIDTNDISALHARVGFDDGAFWIEDLGSTNGTFIGEQQVSGRVTLGDHHAVQLGFETVLMGVASEEELRRVVGSSGHEPEYRPATLQRAAYPSLVSLSEVARPARVLLTKGNIVKVGRDPASDMWIGVPHVSRIHFTLQLSDDGTVVIRDQSTNGTTIDGEILKRGSSLEAKGLPKVFDLGGGVTIALCFSGDDESSFTDSGGMKKTFQPPVAAVVEASPGDETISEIPRRAVSDTFARRAKIEKRSPALMIAAGLSGLVVVSVCAALLVPLLFK